ncbi:MAG: SUMF1/EgtB/PvdO family nonheme iron enzyme, partial [Pseudolabrys sp.]
MTRRTPTRSCLTLLLLGVALSIGTARTEERKDREFKECADCPVMVGIPTGSFVMGSPQSESGRFDTEGPQHKVAIKAFALGKYDITSEQFL